MASSHDMTEHLRSGNAKRKNGNGKAKAPPMSFADEMLAALLRYKAGDFGSRMPVSFVGIEGKIADVLNDVLAVSDRRAGEIQRVCRVVGKEGKLKQRMSVPGARGG
jgi:hypothetical protein